MFQKRAQVRLGSKGEELTVSITSPLCGAKADVATRPADFAFGLQPDMGALWQNEQYITGSDMLDLPRCERCCCT